MSDRYNDKNISFSEHIIKIANDKTYFGRMNDPTCSAREKGICGDEMEFYLVISDNKIVDAKFWTTGCFSSKACGLTLINYIINKEIYNALTISPNYILKELIDLPIEHHHCSILACITFYKAIGEYLIKK